MIGLLQKRVSMNEQSIDLLVREIKTDVGFRDYFNKFCCLPIFGQRVAFRLSGKQLLLDPSPMESTQRLSTISQDLILRWLMSRRFDLFNKSRVGCEYKLFLQLKDEVFTDSRLENLKKKHLKRVSHMSSFLRFIHKNTQEGVIIDFWVDVERMKQEQMLSMPLRAIQAKYFMKSSPLCLPSVILEAFFPSKMENSITTLDYDQSIRLSDFILKRLHSHWLVRYILMNEKNVNRNADMEARKLAAMDIREGEIKHHYESVMGANMVNFVKEGSCPPAVDVVLTGDDVIIKNKSKTLLEEREYTKEESSSDDINLLTPSMALLPICQNCTPTCAQCEDGKTKLTGSQSEGSVTSESESRLYTDVETASDASMRPEGSVKSSVPDIKISGVRKVPKWKDEVELSGGSDELKIVESVHAYFSTIFTQIEEERKGSRQKLRIPHPPKDVCSQGNLLCKMMATERTQGNSGEKEQHSMNNIMRIARSSTTASKIFTKPPTGLTPSKPKYPVAKTGVSWNFASVLATDEVCAFPFRVYLLTVDTKSLIGGSGCQGMVKKSVNVLALDLWREIEGLRTCYFVCEAIELKRRTRNIKERLIAFKSIETHTSKLVEAISRRTEYPFPLRLVLIQLKLEEILKPLWITFASSEQFEFKRVIVKAARLGKKAVALDGRMTSESEPWLPKLGHLDKRSSDLECQESEVRTLEDVSSLFRICHQEMKDMRYRTARAFCLTMTSSRHNMTSDVVTNELYNIDDVSSDEEGDIPPATPPKYSKLRKLDPAQIARLSAKQYPVRGVKNSSLLAWEYNKESSSYAPIRSDVPQAFSNSFRHNGMLIRRPSEKPESFKEILTDPVHFEFLRRFMKSMGGDTPLRFLNDIYKLANIKSPKQRRLLTKSIMKKYFKSLDDPCEQLQCYTPAIHDVIGSRHVTTEMLIQGARDVEESLEKNWGMQYMATFKTPVSVVTGDEAAHRQSLQKKLSIRKGKSTRLFQQFIRRTSRFFKEMTKTDSYKDFRKYLMTTCKPLLVSMAGESGSNESVANNVEDQVPSDPSVQRKKIKLRLRYTRKEVCGKKIILQFLPNDLDMLLECHRFLQMYDNMIFIYQFGCFDENDGLDVHKKIWMINECFLESTVPPKIRVNLPRGLSETISSKIHQFQYGRDILHTATLTLLQIILHYWQEYCLVKYSYVSRRVLKERRKSEVQERRRQSQHLDEVKTEKLRRKLYGEESLPSLSQQASSVDTSPTYKAPDYINGWPSTDPWSQEIGNKNDKAASTLTFSLAHGLKLVHVPPTIPNLKNRRSIPSKPTENLPNLLKFRRHTVPTSNFHLPSIDTFN